MSFQFSSPGLFQDLLELLLGELSIDHLLYIALFQILMQRVDESQECGQRTQQAILTLIVRITSGDFDRLLLIQGD